MSDKGTLAQLKTSISGVLDNNVGDGFISPQKHNNILVDVIDTISPTHGTAAGTDTYTVAMAVTQVAYSDHKLYLVSFPNTNTGAATLDVDSLGAKGLKKGANIDLAASDIVVGKIYEIRYDATADALRINI
jgi:hypothetical protein